MESVDSEKRIPGLEPSRTGSNGHLLRWHVEKDEVGSGR